MKKHRDVSAFVFWFTKLDYSEGRKYIKEADFNLCNKSVQVTEVRNITSCTYFTLKASQERDHLEAF